MATPSSTFTEMVSTTLRNQATDVVDAVSNNNALLRALKKRGNIKAESGGYEISFPIEYTENQTYSRYTGYDTQDIRASDVLTAVKYDWAQAAIHVTASGRELRMNNGPEAMIKLVKARIANAKHTAANNMATDIYSDGSITNQMGGLQALLSTAGTGTVGGINAGTYSNWQNKVTEMSGTNTWSSTTILGEFNKLWLLAVNGTDKPDIIVASHDIYSALEASMQANQRYMAAESATAGFEELRYKSATVIFDDNTNFGTTAERAYFLNTKYLYLVQHSEAQWTQDDDKIPLNQDAVVVPMYWMGNLVLTNRRRQGLLIDAA